VPDVVAVILIEGARAFAAGAFLLSVIVALTHWGVRRGSIAPFGGWARFVRRWSDPVIIPLERRLVRSGANPQDAPIWLVGVAVVLGLIVVALADWLVGFIATLDASVRNGFLLAMLVHSIFELLMLAIMIRVIASWINASPYSLVMRIIHGMTDWLIDPIRRVVPTVGMFDISPLVAYFVLYLVEQMVMRAFF
jgi:YggT family protein